MWIQLILGLLVAILLVHTVDEESEALQATSDREVSSFGGVDLDERHVEFLFVEQRRDAAAA
jgi:hypothetical protein